MKKKIKEFLSQGKPFILFIDVKHAIRKGVSVTYVFTQYPETRKKIKLLENGLLIKSSWVTYQDCRCDDFYATKIDEEIPYSKIKNVEILPPEIDSTSQCLIIGYVCNTFPRRAEPK